MRKVIGTGLSRNGIEVFHSKAGSSKKILPINKEGLVLYITADMPAFNIVFDCSGKNNHGIRYGATVINNGKIKQGLQFDGIDDYVDCGVDNSLNMVNENFTVSLWFITNNPGSGSRDLLMKGAYSPGGKNYSIISINGGNLSIAIDDNANGYKIVTSSINYMDGNWHYVVGVRDSNNLRLYVDGNEDANSPTDITNYGSLDSIRSLRLGCGSNEPNNGNPGNWFAGKIDEIKIYNRALSSEEILADYQREV